MGRGAGLGVELDLGASTTLVVGAGVAGNVGYSSIDGWVGGVTPGVAFGLRRHLGRWYVGPSLGVGYTIAASDGAAVEERQLDLTALLDVGYAWAVGRGDELRLGLSGGARFVPDAAEGEARFAPVVALTLSYGFDL
jgi:hypothetical protein